MSKSCANRVRGKKETRATWNAPPSAFSQPPESSGASGLSPAREAVYLDDQELFVEVAQSLGLHGIHHTSYATTRTALAALGLTLPD